MASSDEASEFVQEHPEITHLDALLVDLCGEAYGKRLPRDHASGLYEYGTPVCAAMSLVDVQWNTADPTGHGFSDGDPYPVVHPVPGRLVPVPWAPGLAQVLCEPRAEADGGHLWDDPRTVMAAVLAGIHHGLTARFAPGERHTGSEPDVALPLKLWRALDAIRQARILPGYLGDRYCEIYADVKQAEFDAFMRTVSRQEHHWYL